jgi:hypothetical protein
VKSQEGLGGNCVQCVFLALYGLPGKLRAFMCCGSVGMLLVGGRSCLALVGGSGGTMVVCVGANLKSTNITGSPVGGATLGGGAFRSRNGGGVSSCEMTLLSVLDKAGTIGVACGATAMVVMFGAGCEGSCDCDGVHAVCCLKMVAS